jgi:hypothetical protein
MFGWIWCSVGLSEEIEYLDCLYTGMGKKCFYNTTDRSLLVGKLSRDWIFICATEVVEE